MATTIADVPDWMTSFGMPVYLQKDPLKKPLNHALRDTLTCLPAELILMVTHFALDKLKFDTVKMIEVVKKATPLEWIASGEDYAPLNDRRSVPGALVLEETPERRLITTMETFFAFHSHTNASKMSEYERQQGTDEIQSLYGYIEGIELVEHDRIRIDECHDYVFGGLPWFSHDLPELFGEPHATLTYLESRGFKRSLLPMPGAVVIYAKPNEVKHFAKVESVKDGKTVVLSKDSIGPLYRHELKCMFVSYGCFCFFLIPPQGS